MLQSMWMSGTNDAPALAKAVAVEVHYAAFIIVDAGDDRTRGIHFLSVGHWNEARRAQRGYCYEHARRANNCVV